MKEKNKEGNTKELMISESKEHAGLTSDAPERGDDP